MEYEAEPGDAFYEYASKQNSVQHVKVMKPSWGACRDVIIEGRCCSGLAQKCQHNEIIVFMTVKGALSKVSA